MRVHALRRLSVCLGLLFFLPAAHAQSTFVFTDLGTLGGTASNPTGINDSGQVVGSSTTAGNQTHAVIWNSGVPTDLGTLGGTTSSAAGINASGQVVGWSATTFNPPTSLGGNHAAVWNSGVPTDLGTLGGVMSFGYAINNSGQIAGIAYNVSNAIHTATWTGGVPTDLGPNTASGVSAINASGQVVGQLSNHAVIWNTGVPTDLGTLGGTNSSASGINDSGQVVGSAQTAGNNYHAFVYENGTMYDLNNYVTGAAGWTLTNATAINDLGQIVGTASDGSQTHAFLLTAIPEPSAFAAAAGLGALSLVILWRRRTVV